MTGNDQQRVVSIVDAILATKGADIKADVAAEEKALDRVVQELYGA